MVNGLDDIRVCVTGVFILNTMERHGTQETITYGRRVGLYRKGKGTRTRRTRENEIERK